MDWIHDQKSAGIGYTIFFIVFVLLSFIGQSILSFFYGADSFAYKFICGFFSCVSLVAVCILFSVKRKQKFIKTVSINKFNPVFIVFSLLLLFGMYFGLGLVNTYVSDFIESIGLNIINTEIEMSNAWQYLGFVLVLALLPAVTEEMFFRGFMLSSLKKCSPIISMVFVALCFSLYHGNVSQLIYQFIFGLFMCGLAYFSGSVFPCIIAHFLNNFIILTILYFGWNIDYLNYNIVLIVSGIVALVALFVLALLKVKKENKDKKYESIKDAYIFALMGIVLNGLMVILNLVM